MRLHFLGTARKSPRVPAPLWWAELRGGEVASGAPSEELLAANLGLAPA